MKKLKFLSLLFSVIIFLYIGISWFLLDGKLIYTTSFNESTIEASKREHLFISQDLNITSEEDSLQKWNELFDVWTNQRFEIKYFGVLFHWTYTKPEWRYLNIGFKNESYPYTNDWCIRDLYDGYSRCCNRIGCKVGDTVIIDFYKCKYEKRLGNLKVIIK